MPRQKIAVAMIAGDGIHSEVGREDFDRCLQSLYGVVDRVFVAYNGSKDLPKLAAEYNDIDVYPPATWRWFKWDDDFGLARNESFDMVYNYMDLADDKFDWILWVDTDDTLEYPEGGDGVDALLHSLDSETQVVMLRYDYAVDPDTDQVLAVQWRERFFRTDTKPLWVFPIHEICRTPPATQYAKREGVWIRHWRNPGVQHEDTRARNRKIIAKARREYPNEPRFAYYFANEVYAEAAIAAQEGRDGVEELCDAAIKAYEDYVPNSPSPDDAYLAIHQIAELHRIKKDFLPAIETELQALMVHPTWPDAYVGIAQSYMELEQWDKCEFWARACLANCGKQETTQVREPLNDAYIPHLLLGIALEQKGEIDEALANYEWMQEHLPSSEVDKKMKVLQAKKDQKGQELLTPLWELDRKRYFGTSQEKSICFFNRPSFEPWHPELYKKGNGIGGTETCVMEVSKRFAQDGWRVVVFGTPGDYKGVDENGVEWYESNDYSITEPFTVVVGSRVPELFDTRPNAKMTMLWMHDVNTGDNMVGDYGNRLDNIDKVIGLTPWHVNHLQRLYEVPAEKMTRIPNGVDLSRFTVEESKRQPHKFIWSSSPDRGIDSVLNFWPGIRRRWPDAELHVFYGWNSIDKILKLQPDNTLGVFKMQVEQLIEDLGGEYGGIFWHDRVNQKELADHMTTCDMWLYPTSFMETFCITAVEMQAAGVVPVTSNTAALKNIVGDTTPGLVVDGWPNNVSFMREFMKTVERVDEMSPEDKTTLRDYLQMNAANYTWAQSFRAWKENVEEVL